MLCHTGTYVHPCPPPDYWYISFFFLVGPGRLHEIARAEGGGVTANRGKNRRHYVTVNMSRSVFYMNGSAPSASPQDQKHLRRVTASEASEQRQGHLPLTPLPTKKRTVCMPTDPDYLYSSGRRIRRWCTRPLLPPRWGQPPYSPVRQIAHYNTVLGLLDPGYGYLHRCGGLSFPR